MKTNIRQMKRSTGLGVLIVSLISLAFISIQFDENKSNIIEQQTQLSISTKPQIESSKRLNILALGGSVTWGGGKQLKREDTYTFRLGSDYGHHVTNLAIRGTGSDFPAQCIDSMLRSAETNDPNIPFDVILFEFSMNGMHGFSLLLERLRKKYPDALFIYIDLFSLTTPRGQFDSNEAHKLIREYGGIVYFFGHWGEPTAEFSFRDEIDRSNPPDYLKELYGDDLHHLNYNGHEFVTKYVQRILQSQEFPSIPRVGSWLGGDKCISWFETGETRFLRIIEGGKMKQFDTENNKWAIEVDPKEGTILEYFHNGNRDAPFNLQYMTKSVIQDDSSSSIYPPVVVKIEQDEKEIMNAKQKATNSEVILQRKDVSNVGVIDGWKYISGLHKKKQSRRFHVNDISNIGILKPGRNFIYIYEVESRPSPFRITATITCEACGALGENILEWF